MGRKLTAVAVVGLCLGLASPAQAQLLIDNFTVGAFNLMGGPVGTTATQTCGSFCLSGTREVFIGSNLVGETAFAQLSSSTGEAASVLPDTDGGQMAFTYALGGAPPVDLTQGATATLLEVWFTAFEPVADVSVRLEDDTGVSQTVVVTNLTFTPAPSLSTPEKLDFALSDFASVDLERILEVEVKVEASHVGDYHLALIIVPRPNVSKIQMTITNPDPPIVTGPPYPSGAITLEGAVSGVSPEPFRTVDLEVSMVNVSNAAGPLPTELTATLVPQPDGSDVVSFLNQVFWGIDTSPFQEVIKIDFLPPVGGAPPDDSAPVLSWDANHFHVSVALTVEGGVQTVEVFGEPLGTINFANVTATQGSTLITVDVEGSGNDPSLLLTLGGTFTANAPAPALPPWAWLLLAALLVGAVGLVAARLRSSA